MPTVDLIACCCPKDIQKTYDGWDALAGSHQYAFHEIMLVRQRCRGMDVGTLPPEVRVLETENYPEIFGFFGIAVDDPETQRIESRGNKYFWQYHSMNHFIGLFASDADYIAFTDCDNLLRGDVRGNSWVDRGIKILQERPDVIMVCPNQWGPQPNDQTTNVISQCMFLCERERFLTLDYNTPCPTGVERGNFHLELEGRLWCYAQKHGVSRMMLSGPPLLIHQAW